MRQRVTPFAALQKSVCLKLESQVLFAEIELNWFPFFAASPDRLEPLMAGLAVGRFVPDERFGITRFDPVTDIEKSVGFSILRHQQFRDCLLGVVVNLEGVIVRESDGRGQGDGDERASEQSSFGKAILQFHKM
jgi:hypothetical protein